MSSIEIPGYKIIRTLGVGGQATVYLAIQTGFEREVALKVMSPVLAVDPTFGERFIREAKIVAKLSHKSIVTVYDVGQSGSFYYLAMEYMPRGDLKTRIADGMKARECLDIISKLALALHFAHEKGYVHRDVKSENILFDEDNEAVLTDFGIAKASNSTTQMTQTGKLIGTPEYMSPEQCRGKKIDGRSDLYSLGIILFEMLTRRVPYTGEDSVSICIMHVTQPLPKLPVRLKHFQWLLELLLSKEPSGRFQSGVELAKAVNEFKKTGKQTTQVDKAEIAEALQGKRNSSTSQTLVNQNIDNDEHFDQFDDLHTEKRELISEDKPKSNVVIMSFIGVMFVSLIVGFMSKDLWFEQSRQWLKTTFTGNGNTTHDKLAANSNKRKLSTEQQSTNKNILDNSQTQINKNKIQSDILKSQNTEASLVDSMQDNSADNSTKILANATPDFDPKTMPSVEELIQQADRLVQYLPHKLSDLKQALKLIETVSSLDINNSSAKLIYQNILSVCLSEATNFAEKNQFEESQEWLDVVAYEQVKHPLLVATQNNISRMKASYDSQVKDRFRAKQDILDMLSKADIAMTEKRLIQPLENNALYYYQKILSLDANNIDAIAGIDNTKAGLLELTKTAIDNSAFNKAKSLISQLDSLTYDQTVLNSLRLRLAQAEEKRSVIVKEENRLAEIADEARKIEQARQTKLNDPIVQKRVSSKLISAQELYNQGFIVEPKINNALDKYRSVLEIDDRNEFAIDSIKRIEKKLLSDLTDAVASGNKLQAKVELNKLRLFDPKHNQLMSFEDSIINMIEDEPESGLVDSTDPLLEAEAQLESDLIFEQQNEIESESESDTEENGPDPQS